LCYRTASQILLTAANTAVIAIRLLLLLLLLLLSIYVSLFPPIPMNLHTFTSAYERLCLPDQPFIMNAISPLCAQCTLSQTIIPYFVLQHPFFL